jgi:hypothetical protein
MASGDGHVNVLDAALGVVRGEPVVTGAGEDEHIGESVKIG